MRHFLKATGNLLAALIALLFIVTLLASIILTVFENRLLDADAYLEAFGRDDFYQELPAMLSMMMVSGARSELADETGGEEQPTFMKYLTVQDWQIMLELLLPPEATRLITENAVREVFGVLNGRLERATFDLRPIKEQLRTNGAQAYLQVIRAQPPCTEEELAQVWGDSEVNPEELLCRPDEEVLATLLPGIQESVLAETEAMQDVVILLDATRQPVAETFQELRTAMRLTLLVPLMLLALMTVLAVRTLKEWLRWWGIPLVIGSGLMVLSGFAGSPLLQIALNRAAAEGGEGLRTGQVALAVVHSISQILFQPVSWIGLLLGLLGAGLWLASLLLPQELLESE